MKNFRARPHTLLLLFAAALLCAGCELDSKTGAALGFPFFLFAGDDDDDDPPPPAPAPPAAPAPGLIGPAGGSFAQGSARLEIQAGVLSQPFQFSIASTGDVVDSTQRAAGGALRFSPSADLGLSGGGGLRGNNFVEQGETSTGGNGFNGDDEMSEPGSNWTQGTPQPGVVQ